MNKLEKKPLHRAWLVLIGCVMVQSSTNGIINNIGQFYKPLSVFFSTEANPVGISDVAIGRTAQMLASAIFVYIIGKPIMEKYYKKSLIVCSVIYSMQYFALAACKSLTQTYIIMFTAGIALTILQMLCIMATINRWFYKSKGLALSISTSGAGLMSIIVSPVTGNIIEHLGWRAGFIFFGILTFVLSVGGSVFFMERAPEDFGLKPYGWDDEAEEKIKRAKEAALIKGRVSIFKRADLYIVIFVHCTFQFLMTSQAHVSSYASSIGYGIVAASYISAVSLMGNTSMKMIVGILRDKMGITKAAIIEIVLAGTGYLLLLFNTGIVTLYIGVFLVGSVMSCSTVVSPVLQSDHFKGDDFNKALAFVSMFGALVGSFANYFYGWICDVTGSYASVFDICTVLLVIDIFLLLYLEKKNRTNP